MQLREASGKLLQGSWGTFRTSGSTSSSGSGSIHHLLGGAQPVAFRLCSSDIVNILDFFLFCSPSFLCLRVVSFFVHFRALAFFVSTLYKYKHSHCHRWNKKEKIPLLKQLIVSFLLARKTTVSLEKS